MDGAVLGGLWGWRVCGDGGQAGVWMAGRWVCGWWAGGMVMDLQKNGRH